MGGDVPAVKVGVLDCWRVGQGGGAGWGRGALGAVGESSVDMVFS
jgi:hypothetical protein